MTATLRELLAVRSRLADEVVVFCDSAVAILDSMSFHYRDSQDGSVSPAVSISGTVVDARVFTERLEAPDRDSDGSRPKRSWREDDAARQPANDYEKKLAELDETPWQAEGRESIRWSQAMARANRQRPLVVRGAPGSGKTTLSRYSAIKRLKAVRDALNQHTHLVEECEPMLWTTCTALARATGSTEHPADLVITAVFAAMNLPADSPSCGERMRRWLRERIAAGACPVAFDSLDEVIPQDQPAFRERAPRLLHLGSPAVLTCRVLEWSQWHDRIGWPAMELVELAPLTPREQRDYARNFFEKETRRPELLFGFRQQLPGLRTLCRSPILLFFACLLHAGGERSGNATRTELYQRIRRRLLRGEWRNQPPPEWTNDEIDERRVTTWLCDITLALFRAAPESKTFSLEAWDAAVKQAGPCPNNPPISSDTLLGDLKRCGFVVYVGLERDQPHYAFPHRTFLAYLAGAALAKRPRETWLKEARDHLWFQPAWEDVLLFLAGHLDELEMDALLDEVEKQPEDIFRQRLRWQWRFAAQATSVSSKWVSSWGPSACELMLNSTTQVVGVTPFGATGAAWRQLFGALRTACGSEPELLSALISSLEAIYDSGGFVPQSMEVWSDRPMRSNSRKAKAVIYPKVVGALGGTPQAIHLLKLLDPQDPQHDPDWVVRLVAAKALGLIEDVGSVHALLSLLDPEEEPNEHVRHGVAKALGQIGDPRATDALSASLQADPDRNVRATVALALGHIGDQRAVPALLASLRSDEVLEVLECVATALGEIGDIRALDGLLARIHSARTFNFNQRIGVRAAEALGQMGGREAADSLVASLDPRQTSDWVTRESVAIALGRIRDSRAITPLLASIAASAGRDGYVRGRFIEALGSFRESRTVDGLLRYLDPIGEPDKYLRTSVAKALGNIGDAGAVKSLLASLESRRDPDGDVRASVSEALGKIGDKRAVSFLLTSLDPAKEPEWLVRLNVAEALGAIGDTRAIDGLLTSLRPAHEPISTVRGAVARALTRLGEGRVLEALLASFDSAHEPKEDSAREYIASALGKVGDRIAVEVLFRHLD